MTKRKRRKVRAGNPTQAVAYLRVSTEEQHLGPEAQRAEIQAWADREGVCIISWHEDRLGGATPIDQRPGLVNALAALESTGAGLLLAQKRDRLARDVVVAAMLQRTVAEMGATISTVAEAFLDLESPEGQFIATIFDAFGQLERARISARTKAALLAKRARGEKTGGEAPFGYRATASGHLKPDATEQRTMARARTLAKDGRPQREIAEVLAAEGHHGRTGKPLHQTQVGRLLRTAATPPAE